MPEKHFAFIPFLRLRNTFFQNRSMLLLIGAMLICSLEAIAQEIEVAGTLSDVSTKEPLMGAVLKFDKDKSTVTSENGKYRIMLPPGQYQVQVSMLGYITQLKKLNVTESNTALNFYLEAGTLQLEQVVITSGKFEQKLSDITVSMDVVKPRLVENKNTVNLETIAEQVPGLTILDGQANIRNGSGFSYGAGSRVLMLVDEMPMLAADAGDIKWSYLPIESLEQMEVIKGAASCLYGSSALNGVINIRTAYPREKPQTKITLFSGVYDNPMRATLKWWTNNNPILTGANFFHSRKIGSLDLVTSGHVYGDQGYRKGENEQRGRMNVNLKYHFRKIRGLSIGVNTNAMATQGGYFILWQSSDSAYLPQAGTLSNYITYRYNIDPSITYFAKNGDRHVLRTRYFNTTNTNNTNQESIGELYYSEYQYMHTFKRKGVINAGLVGIRNVVISDSLYGNHTGFNQAAYLQYDKKYFGKLTVSTGLRMEYFELDKQPALTDLEHIDGNDTLVLFKQMKYRPVVRIGATYQLFDYTFLRGSYGQGYRYPSVAEKYVTTQVGPLTVFPNKDIRSETGHSVEFGVKQGFKAGKWSGFLDASWFVLEYRNMMEFAFGVYFPDTASANYQQFILNKAKFLGFKSVNVSNALIKGFEISGVVNGKAGPVEISFFGGYTYTNPIDLNYVPSLDTLKNAYTNVLKYRFFHNIKGDVQLDYKKFSVGLSSRYNSRIINIDESFQQPVFSYLIPGAKFGPVILPGLENYRKIHNTGDLYFDLRLGYQLNTEARVSLIVNNMLNDENMGRPGDIQPPRTLMIQYLLKI